MTQCPIPVVSTLSANSTHNACPLEEAYSLWSQGEFIFKMTPKGRIADVCVNNLTEFFV